MRFLLFFFFAGFLSAQERTEISGEVVSEVDQKPLKGVVISFEGSHYE